MGNKTVVKVNAYIQKDMCGAVLLRGVMRFDGRDYKHEILVDSDDYTTDRGCFWLRDKSRIDMEFEFAAKRVCGAESVPVHWDEVISQREDLSDLDDILNSKW